jgi:hypothetical protein
MVAGVRSSTRVRLSAIDLVPRVSLAGVRSLADSLGASSQGKDGNQEKADEQPPAAQGVSHELLSKKSCRISNAGGSAGPTCRTASALQQAPYYQPYRLALHRASN